MSDDLIRRIQQAQVRAGEDAVMADLVEKGLIEPPTLSYWPYCERCHEPFDFDEDQPFGHCKCGTTEWGHPRPAKWVPNPWVQGEIVKVAQAMLKRADDENMQIGMMKFTAKQPDGPLVTRLRELVKMLN
jgi:hypothetical protein